MFPLNPNPVNNVTEYEVREALYNERLISDLIRIGTSDEHWLFYSKVAVEHNIKPVMGTADGVRTALLQHLFSGECQAQGGPQCKDVVSGAQCPQSVAVRMIDLVVGWIDDSRFSTHDLQYICYSLGLTSAGVQPWRVLLSKFTSRRRQLIKTLDVMEHSLEKTVQNMGSSSKMEDVRAMCEAHNVPVQDEGKDDLVVELFDHIVNGRCVDKKGPACGNVYGEMTPTAPDAIHTQVCVLRHIHPLLSTRQLRKVMNLLDVDYGDDESKKKLKSRLLRYVQSLEKGKLKESDAERVIVERLEKLEHIRRSWPNLVPPQLKERLVKEFKESTSSTALTSFTCACCARTQPIKEKHQRSHEEIGLDLLEGPASHWASEEMAPPPTPFSDGPLENKLVDENGVRTSNDGTVTLDLCTSCLRSLRRRVLPKHALANRLYVGPVPKELSDLTMVEESLIARARAKSWIVKLQETENGQSLPTSQRALKGHTIIYPQEPERLATLLPPPIEDALTFICVVFVGSTRVTPEWLKAKAKPLVVRREKVYMALKWLKANNPLYQNVEIALDNLNALPVDDILPYHVEHMAPDEAQATLTSRYDNVLESDVLSPEQTHFEGVVVADVDAHTPAKQWTAAAIQHVKSKGRPFVQVSHGPEPMNEFSNMDLFPMIYPTLFPYGCGGFEDHSRAKAISVKEHVKYLFSQRDKRFRTHYSFLFTVFNVLQRHSSLLHAGLKVKKWYFSKFAHDLAKVSSEVIGEMLLRIEKGEKVVPRTEEEQRVWRLMKEVNLVTSKVPGSSAARVSMRNEIRALTMTHGMPSFYITVNPADTHNPVVKFLSGEDIEIDNMLEGDIPNVWEQSRLVSSNPALGARFFNLYLKAFLRVILGCREDGLNAEGGVLGVVKAHYGCVEAQGRGSLHCHMLVWIDGALNPNEIREKVMKDEDWGRKLLAYLDDTVTNVVPEDPLPGVDGALDEKDPCTLRGANLDNGDVRQRLAARGKDVSRLAERVQRHRHTHTCYKHHKTGEAKTCRFELSEDNYRGESIIDQETGSVQLRCLDGLVNNFNMTMLEAVRCNMDIQFIGSGESAKAMIYYVTDYITKSPLKSHVTYAALQQAVRKYEQVVDEYDDSTLKSKRLLQKCAYALISHQELSAQQVASYLLGYEDHFTSHSFVNLYWPSFERFIDRQDPLKLQSEGKMMEDKNFDVNGGVEVGEKEELGVRLACEMDDTSPEEEDDEEVVIAVHENGQITERSDQVSDYTLRPDGLEDLCLWDFVARTEKVSQHGSRCQTGNVSDKEGDNTGDDDEVEEKNGKQDDEGRRNRKRTWRFRTGHKEHDRKFVRMWKREAVPVPIGPAIPRRDQVETYKRYCRVMLMLFRPWREPRQLRETGDEWSKTYQDFSTAMKGNHRLVVDNMQILHECRDSRDDHMQTRARQRGSFKGGGLFVGNADPEDELAEVDMAEVLEHLEDIDRMSSRKTDALDRETQMCIQEFEDAGWYSGSNGESGSGTGDSMIEWNLGETNGLEDEWKNTYEKRKVEWRNETRSTDDGADSSCDTRIAQLGNVEVLNENVIIGKMVNVEDRTSNDEDTSEVMRQLVEKWTLNVEQRRAFNIVAGHMTEVNGAQLLMYLGGSGGTGKSRVVNALRDFFDRKGEGRRFRLAAYTGVAARNIGGATLHSLLRMNESGRRLGTKSKRELVDMWDGVDYLFIDEVSMIGCEMLHNISSVLTEATGKTCAFGGVNVVLAGDFAQLPPIGDVRLYKNMNISGVASGASKRAQAKVLGKLLWLSIETIVILREVVRQSGSENKQFVDLLQRLRTGICTQEDYGLLKSRVLQEVTLTVDEGWRMAPVIVSNNATRDAINVRATQAFAARTGKDLQWYHAVDMHKRVEIKDAGLIEKLEKQHSGQTKHRLRRIPLVMGMPVSINQNFDVRAGVVNGSWGTLRAVRYETGQDGRRYLTSGVVEIRDADQVEMVDLPKHHFPVLPDVTEINFENNTSHRRCMIKRRQVPMEPGFAITAHKAQGKTMSRVVVDLAGCSGTEQPYVMISRCTSLEGLIILRNFEFKKITCRQSEDLRREGERLELLRLQTIVKYGAVEEVKRAKDEIHRLKVGESMRGRKRKMDEDKGRRKKVKGSIE